MTMTTEQLDALYERRPYKARCVKTSRIVGFNTLVDLRDALSDGHVVRIEAERAKDPSRNYERLTRDQLRQRCQMRNVKGFLTMGAEDQIKALRMLDARDDAELLKAKAEPEIPSEPVVLDDGPEESPAEEPEEEAEETDKEPAGEPSEPAATEITE